MVFKAVDRLPEFDKDIKRLSKRYPTLEVDLEMFVDKELRLFHKLKIDNHGVFRIPELRFEEPKIYKGKKFACRSLKGKGAMSGIRVVYAYFELEDRIELIEIYYKGDKEIEDKKRIRRRYSGKLES